MDFSDVFTYFNLQIVDTGSQFSLPDYIKVDTTEFKFDNGTSKITWVYVEVISGGYLKVIDNTSSSIYYGIDTIYYLPQFTNDSLSLIMEPGFSCIGTPTQMQLRLVVAFNYYLPPLPVQAVNKKLIQLFPNPSNGLFYIKNTKEEMIYEIYDGEGIQIKREQISSSNESINMGQVSEGIYFLKIFYLNKKNPPIVRKIIVKNH